MDASFINLSTKYRRVFIYMCSWLSLVEILRLSKTSKSLRAVIFQSQGLWQKLSLQRYTHFYFRGRVEELNSTMNFLKWLKVKGINNVTFFFVILCDINYSVNKKFITSLDLSNTNISIATGFSFVMESFPNLEEVSFYRDELVPYNVEELDCFFLDHVERMSIVENRTLRVLNICSPDVVHSFAFEDNFMEKLLGRFKSLETLSLHLMEQRDQKIVLDFLPNLKAMQLFSNGSLQTIEIRLPPSLSLIYLQEDDQNIGFGEHEKRLAGRIAEFYPNIKIVDKDLFQLIPSLFGDHFSLSEFESVLHYVTCPNKINLNSGLSLFHSVFLNNNDCSLLHFLLTKLKVDLDLPMDPFYSFNFETNPIIDSSLLIDPFHPIYPFASHQCSPSTKCYLGMTLLHYAASIGDIVKMEFLLSNGANVNSRMRISQEKILHGATPLMVASYNHQIKAIEFLCGNKANVTLKTEAGWNAVHFTALSKSPDREDCVSKLISFGCPLSEFTNEGHSVLSLSLTTDNSLIELLASLGAKFPAEHLQNLADEFLDPELLEIMKLPESSTNNEKKRFKTRLMLSVIRQNQLELNRKVPVLNAQDTHGMTALHYSLVRQAPGYYLSTESLLFRGADPCIQEDSGMNSLLFFFCNLTNNAPHFGEYVDTVFFDQDLQQPTRVLKSLLKSATTKGSLNELLNSKDENGLSPLHLAACIGRDSLLEILIDSGAQLDVVDSLGRSSLFYLFSCVSKLESEHSESFSTTSMKPFERRQRNDLIKKRKKIVENYTQCFRMLLRKGANVNLQDYSNKNILHYICEAGIVQMLECITISPEIVNVVDREGQTPLILAAKNRNAKICEALLRNSADPTVFDLKGRSALTHLLDSHKVEMISSSISFTIRWERHLPLEDLHMTYTYPPFFSDRDIPLNLAGRSSSKSIDYSSSLSICLLLVERSLSSNSSLESPSCPESLPHLLLGLGMQRDTSPSSLHHLPRIIELAWKAGVDFHKTKNGENGLHFVLNRLAQFLSLTARTTLKSSRALGARAFLRNEQTTEFFSEILLCLSKLGFDMCKRNLQGNSCLHLLATVDPTLLAQLLRESPPKQDITNCSRETIMHALIASRKRVDTNFIDALNLLTKLFPSSLNTRNECGITPIMLCCQSSDLLHLLPSFLRVEEADFSLTDLSGKSAFHFACSSISRKDVPLLKFVRQLCTHKSLQNGDPMHLKDKQGFSPLDYLGPLLAEAFDKNKVSVKKHNEIVISLKNQLKQINSLIGTNQASSKDRTKFSEKGFHVEELNFENPPPSKLGNYKFPTSDLTTSPQPSTDLKSNALSSGFSFRSTKNGTLNSSSFHSTKVKDVGDKCFSYSAFSGPPSRFHSKSSDSSTLSTNSSKFRPKDTPSFGKTAPATFSCDSSFKSSRIGVTFGATDNYSTRDPFESFSAINSNPKSSFKQGSSEESDEEQEKSDAPKKKRREK